MRAHGPAAVLVLLSAWLYFSGLDAKNFGADEYHSLEVARLSWGEVMDASVRHASVGNTPVLYPALQKLSVATLGVSEWSLRLPSALAALAGGLLFYVLLSLFFSRVEALLGMTLWVFHPLVVSQAQYGRGYTLYLATAVFLLYALARFLVEPGRGWLGLHVLATALLLNASYLGVLLVALQVPFVIAALRRDHRRVLAAWLAAQGVVVAATLGWNQFFSASALVLDASSTPDFAAFVSLGFWPALAYDALGLALGTSVNPFALWLTLPALVALAALLVLGVVAFWRSSVPRPERLLGWLNGAALVVPSVTLAAIEATQLKPFYLIPAVPSLLMFVLYGVRRHVRVAAAFLAVLVSLQAASIVLWKVGHAEHVVNRALLIPYAAIFTHLAADEQENDTLLVYPAHAQRTLGPYYRGKLTPAPLHFDSESSLPRLGTRVWLYSELFAPEVEARYLAILGRTHALAMERRFVERSSLTAAFRGERVSQPAARLMLWERRP